MSKSPVRKYRARVMLTDEEIVGTIVRQVINEDKNSFTNADLNRWNEARLLPTRTVLLRRFDRGEGEGILNLRYEVADRLRSLGIEPEALPPRGVKPMSRRELIVESAAIARERGLGRPPFAIEIDDISIKTKRLPMSNVIVRQYGGDFAKFQSEVATEMGVDFVATTARSMSRETLPKVDWTPEVILDAALQVAVEEGLTKPATARATAIYARDGRMAGINITERKYVSKSGRGLYALQADVAQMMGWPLPTRAASDGKASLS